MLLLPQTSCQLAFFLLPLLTPPQTYTVRLLGHATLLLLLHACDVRQSIQIGLRSFDRLVRVPAEPAPECMEELFLRGSHLGDTSGVIGGEDCELLPDAERCLVPVRVEQEVLSDVVQPVREVLEDAAFEDLECEQVGEDDRELISTVSAGPGGPVLGDVRETCSLRGERGVPTPPGQSRT